MWVINSKIWFILFSLWLLVVAGFYLNSDITMENINSLLNILAGILATASVGLGAIAYIFVKSKSMTLVLDMVIILIFLSFSSALVAHIDSESQILIFKKVQVFINVAVLMTSCSYIGGYLVGHLNNENQSNKVNKLIKKKKNK